MGRLKKRTIVVGAVAVISGLLLWYCWREVTMEMTAERYAYYCGTQSECYPEWGFFFFGLLILPIVLVTGLAFVGDLVSTIRRLKSGEDIV